MKNPQKSFVKLIENMNNTKPENRTWFWAMMAAILMATAALLFFRQNIRVEVRRQGSIEVPVPVPAQITEAVEALPVPSNEGQVTLSLELDLDTLAKPAMRSNNAVAVSQ